MNRRDFLKNGGALAAAAGIGGGTASGIVPAHNWASTISDQGRRSATG